MSLSKGTGLRNLCQFVHQRFGERAWLELFRDIPDELDASLERPAAGQWYDASIAAHLLRAMCERFAGGDLSLALQAGRASAETNLAGGDRWFLCLGNPQFPIHNMNIYWRREHETGRWTSEIAGDQAILRLHDWDIIEPACCQAQLGYLARLLELFGPVTSPRHSLCRASGAAYCEFRAGWRFSGAPVASMDIASGYDLLDGLRVIAGSGDPALLAGALCDMLAVAFCAARVKLRYSSPGGRTVVHTLGSRWQSGSVLHRFVITHGGRSTGLLEADLPGDLSPERCEQLGDIMSWAGVLFDACQASALHSQDARRVVVQRPARDIEQRLAHAADACSLTRRERDVLSWVVQGYSNREIADSMSIREGTVESHMTNLLRKCDTGNRTGLVAWFWANR